MLQATTLNTITAANNSAATTSTTTVPVISTPAVNTANAANTANAVKTANAANTANAADQTAQAPAVQVPAANTATKSVKVTKKQAKINLQATIANVLATGNALAIKHDDYFETYITKGNDALKVLLTEIMEFAETVFASTDVEAVIKAMRTKLKDSYGIKVQSNSTDMGVIVRYVTRTNRKNAHVYGRTLKAAFDAGITSAELAMFIDGNGGINKIREKNVDTTEAELQVKQRHGRVFYMRDWFADLAKNNAIATFEVDDERELDFYDMTDRKNDFMYMICKRLDDEESNKYAIIDVATCINKDWEDVILLNYYYYKYEEYMKSEGQDEANKEFKRRMQENIARYNAVRARDGRNLLDKYGYEVK